MRIPCSWLARTSWAAGNHSFERRSSARGLAVVAELSVERAHLPAMSQFMDLCQRNLARHLGLSSD